MSIPKGKRVRIDSPDEGILYGVVIGGNTAMGYSVKLDDDDTMIVSHHYLTLLEEIDKPRISKSCLFGWWCQGRGVKLFAETPEQAYNLWEAWVRSSEALEKSFKELEKKAGRV